MKKLKEKINPKKSKYIELDQCNTLPQLKAFIKKWL